MRSADRILTTHVGSLPRFPGLVEHIAARYGGEPIDAEALEREIQECVDYVVRRQLDAGIDIPSDGEAGKIGFSQYVMERFSGFDTEDSFPVFQDLEDFPGVADAAFAELEEQGHGWFKCSAEIELIDRDAVHKDIARFKAALGDRPPSHAFMNACSPGQITFNFANHHYPSHEAYLQAAADAMRYEYKAIADAGLNLQIDAPDLAMIGHTHTPGADVGDHLEHNRLAIAALNSALDGIPPEQIRLHICWGNYAGPHNHDVALADILGPILDANVQTFSFEASNPRHAHEWVLFETLELPEGVVIMPGVVDVTTNRIEHPQLVAERLVRFGRLVGRENVIAGTDCGFGTVAGWNQVHPEVCWAKLATVAEGARIASEILWAE
jgi:5-methyltetrahydropteroyltriglutamate--homocysteine methyltransferase